ncbi:MAG: carbonic anhydrase [Candidatus Melainabacteria bacterium RIFCSPLOWO2_02_FULL_35_15]|nr:MAG: carbonic anhydrase [Candidatus Melainabacteria bacterium RIFCSPLOWO2_12_FULL_35_11]OGI13617.1 MAG: carbonic anhydrase [Candidatus Melainabacteria bacterium RIFCSPLOWO2_02_FULL_35_15]
MKDIASKYQLINISSEKDIPKDLLNTPIADLLKYHNLSMEFKNYDTAQMAIVMCMDNRKQLNIPGKFSYILRTAGARITGSEFKLSFAIGFADIKFVALIAHTNCGMVNLTSKREKFVNGLIKNAGWTKEQAENHFNSFAPFFEIENEKEFIVSEGKRLKEKYPPIVFVPMLYNIEDNKLYIIS